MSVALIGGMDRLERIYMNEAKRFGVKLKVFTQHKTELSSKVSNVDALVIFTNKVSHKAKREAVNMAKTKNIPVLMYHSCGISTLRECFHSLKEKEAEICL